MCVEAATSYDCGPGPVDSDVLLILGAVNFNPTPGLFVIILCLENDRTRGLVS